MGILEASYLTKFCTVTLRDNRTGHFKNHNNDFIKATLAQPVLLNSYHIGTSKYRFTSDGYLRLECYVDMSIGANLYGSDNFLYPIIYTNNWIRIL